MCLTTNEVSFRRLALFWGVTPVLIGPSATTEELVDRVEATLIERNLALPGENVLITMAVPVGIGHADQRPEDPPDPALTRAHSSAQNLHVRRGLSAAGGHATIFDAWLRLLRPVDAGVSIGQVFLGKYRVDSILGHGGMGVVAECTHLALNERVAIKMLRAGRAARPGRGRAVHARGAGGGQAARASTSRAVSDVGTFENGVPYMVMEFLDGHDLGELLEAARRRCRSRGRSS